MAQPAPLPALGSADLTGRRLGRYEVLHQLAAGGMATVYVARAQGVAGFERVVAIKVLHPHLAHDEDFISMFLDEARLAARIHHPNVVATPDISDTQGDGYFLVMEFVEGDHLGSLLRSAARGGEVLPVPVVARIVMDALLGLHAAHTLTDSTGVALDLVHRDVSPHNILVGADGAARITDFGVAKAQVRLSSTRDGQFKGKLSYMAPEQAASGQASQRSDIFSMGIVLWEALTGRRLFRGENNADVLNKILHADVPAPSAFGESLTPFDAVVLKALAKEPGDRYATAEDFADAVEEAAVGLGGIATPRAVGKVVRQWLGDKIDGDHASLRDAIDALGRSELRPGVLPRPMESGSQPSMPLSHSGITGLANGDMTMGAKPSTIAVPDVAEPQSNGGNARWVALCLLLLLVMGGGGLAAWLLFGRPPVQAPAANPTPAQVEPVAPPAPVVAPAAVAEPAVAEPAVEPAVAEPAGEQSGEAATVEPERPEVRSPSRRARRQVRRRGARRAPAADPPGDDDGVIANPYAN